MSDRCLFTLLAGLSLLAAASCHSTGSNSSIQGDTAVVSPVTSLQQGIDSLHERSMDEIAPLRRLEDSIGKKIQDAAARKADTTHLFQVAGNLINADTTMFGWMGQYDMHLEGKTDSEKVAYLRTQLEKLSQISAVMDSSIQDARNLLK